MNPTTLIRAMKILADHTGKSLSCDRTWLMNQVNLLRRAQWKNEAARPIMFKDDGCLCAECYYEDCMKCGRKYTGVTLPQNIWGLHALTINGKTINMTNERIGNNGCCSACGCLSAETLIRRQPLMHDLPPGYKGVVVFKGDAKDDGKRIGVEYVMHSGAVRREDIAVSSSGKETKYSPILFNMITLPERCGWIRIMTQEGYELGSYHPSTTAPSHMRVKLTGVSKGDLVKWEGLREPLDAVFDTDRVEWDDPLEWQNLHQWLELHFKANKNAAEQNTYIASAALVRAGSESELAARQPIPAAHLRPKGVTSLRRQIRRLNRI
jgi:hypothetical protein